MSSADKQLKLLTDAITKLVNTPVAPVLPVAPVAPIAPIPPQNLNDHDTLITLVESVANLDRNVNMIFNDIKRSIKELSDGTTTKISDLESRAEINKNDITKIKTEIQNQITLVDKLIGRDETYVLKKEQDITNADVEVRTRFLERYVWIGIALIGVIEPILITVFIRFLSKP